MRRPVRRSCAAGLALLLGLALMTLVAPPAAAQEGVLVGCDDGGGGIEGYTSGSQCIAHKAYYESLGYCWLTHSDLPDGAQDTLTVGCWYWVPPPWPWQPPPPPPQADLCAYGSTARATDEQCGPEIPVDTPDNRDTVLGALNSTLTAGGGAPLGSPGNPIPLRTNVYKPPPNAPHQWRNISADEAGRSALIGCGASGGTGFVIGGVTSGWVGAGVGLVAGCAGGAATNYLAVALYKDQVHTWYPLVNGRPNPDPQSWYKCVDIKVKPADANSLNPWDVAYFSYPPEYPDLGGTVQPFARHCVPFGP